MLLAFYFSVINNKYQGENQFFKEKLKKESGQLIRKHANFPQRGKSARIQSSLSSPKGEEPCPLILAHGFLNQLT
jgi:hypothetical protein